MMIKFVRKLELQPDYFKNDINIFIDLHEVEHFNYFMEEFPKPFSEDL